jgi:hypothetical protein
MLLCGVASPLTLELSELAYSNQSVTLRHRKKVFDPIIGGKERGIVKGYKAYARGAVVGVDKPWLCIC